MEWGMTWSFIWWRTPFPLSVYGTFTWLPTDCFTQMKWVSLPLFLSSSFCSSPLSTKCWMFILEYENPLLMHFLLMYTRESLIRFKSHSTLWCQSISIQWFSIIFHSLMSVGYRISISYLSASFILTPSEDEKSYDSDPGILCFYPKKLCKWIKNDCSSWGIKRKWPLLSLD